MSELTIFYDERRCGYFVEGLGFDFSAYFTIDIDEDECILSQFIECDHVSREGYDEVAHIAITLHGCDRPSNDIVETQIFQALMVYWPDL